jgi:hypothetical protein
MNREDLEYKSEEELRDMAKNIPGVAQSEMSKDELIDAIMKNQQGGGQEDQGQNNPTAPGQDGGQDDTPPQSDNPEDWKNESGNQS